METSPYVRGSCGRDFAVFFIPASNRSKSCLYDQTFSAYDPVDGAGCGTIPGRKLSQREAASEAVRQIGLNQVEEIGGEWLGKNADRREMFWRRLEILHSQEKE